MATHDDAEDFSQQRVVRTSQADWLPVTVPSFVTAAARRAVLDVLRRGGPVALAGAAVGLTFAGHTVGPRRAFQPAPPFEWFTVRAALDGLEVGLLVAPAAAVRAPTQHTPPPPRTQPQVTPPRKRLRLVPLKVTPTRGLPSSGSTQSPGGSAP